MASPGIPEVVCSIDRRRSVAHCDSASAIAHADPAVLEDAPIVHLQGARLHAITEQHCIELILNSLDVTRGGSVNTMNLDHLRQFVQNRNFAALYDKASIVTADGMPLI